MAQQLSASEARPHLDGIPVENQHRLLAVRVIVEAMADPAQEFSVVALAARTGLTVRQVGEIVTSKEWHELMAQACADRVQASIVVGLARIDRDIIRNPDASPKLILEAVKTQASVYKTLRDAEGAANTQDAELAWRTFLASMKPSETTQQRIRHVEDEARRERPDPAEQDSLPGLGGSPTRHQGPQADEPW